MAVTEMLKKRKKLNDNLRKLGISEASLKRAASPKTKAVMKKLTKKGK